MSGDPTNASRPRGHIAALDGLRGLACLLVLFVHLISSDIAPPVRGFMGALRMVCSQCWSGVDLFFVLSGFLIVTTLLNGEAKPGWIGRYFAARAFRILPVYLLLLVVYTFFVLRGSKSVLFETTVPTWTFFGFGQSWYAGVRNVDFPPFLSVTWSLAAEAEYYLAAFLLVLWAPREKRLLLLGCCILAAWVFRAGILLYFPKDVFAAYILPPARMDGFALGACAAFAARSEAACAYVRGHGTVVTALFGVFFIGIFMLMTHEAPPFGKIAALFSYTWFDLFYVLLLLWLLANAGERESRAFSRGFLPYLGMISYSAFLIQSPIHVGFELLEGREHAYLLTLRDLIYPLGEFCAILAMASFMWYGIEKPFIGLGRRLSRGSR